MIHANAMSQLHAMFNYITPHGDKPLLTYESRVKFKLDNIWHDTTYGRLLIWEGVGILPDRVLDKRGVKRLVTGINEKYQPREAMKKLKILQDISFKIVTKISTSLCIADFKVRDDVEEILDGVFKDSEELDDIEKAIAWDAAISKLEMDWIENVDKNNPLFEMFQSGARVTHTQIRQMNISKGLLTNMDGTLNPDAVRGSLARGLTSYDYFKTIGPARRGLAANHFVVPASGYFARQTVLAARDLVVVQEYCGSVSGVEIPANKAHGRYMVNGSLVMNKDKVYDDELTVKVLSPITCESTKGGICSKCCGVNPANMKPWDIGFRIGIASAQHLSEATTQLGLRGKHTSGSVNLESFKTRIDSTLAQILKAFGAKGTQVVKVGDSEAVSIKTLSYDEGNVRQVAADHSEYIQRLYMDGGIKINLIHFEVMMRACTELVAMGNGDIGIRSFGDKGSILLTSITEAVKKNPSWLKSVSYEDVKRRLKRAVNHQEVSYDTESEKIITTKLRK